MKRRILIVSAVVLFLVALPVAQLVWSKAHVPTKKGQVCHVGEVITLSSNAVRAHLRHDDCQLPVCDFNNVFRTGNTCDVVVENDCALANERREASGTPGCPAGGGTF